VPGRHLRRTRHSHSIINGISAPLFHWAVAMLRKALILIFSRHAHRAGKRRLGSKIGLKLCAQFTDERACINTLEQVLDLCDLPQEEIGVAVDVYNVWWDPKLEQQIRRARKKRLLGHHIRDWLSPTRDLVSDRGMMGDGVIDLPRIPSWMEGAGYRGFQEVEIFSELDSWKRDPDEVLTTCKARHNRCC
jgi:sugar phosphate isomerase/epimerase